MNWNITFYFITLYIIIIIQYTFYDIFSYNCCVTFLYTKNRLETQTSICVKSLISSFSHIAMQIVLMNLSISNFIGYSLWYPVELIIKHEPEHLYLPSFFFGLCPRWYIRSVSFTVSHQSILSPLSLQFKYKWKKCYK